ncbi:hypothetical protein [Agrococcus jejuensis]|uniref:Tetratricopeptide repeat-containing protein n=1 Tax=Agrococcus jejuensis TaxID=399736 RepID=A0A1G8BV45_9MICO|nr:hypothetical protein [Agrococcus jejuensis]SDH37051.1 hypothetical protein SAMN04489720_1066 [Agrococcus jejuensis]
MHAVLGFDVTTLRPTVDVAAATARIDAIGLSRAMADLAERAWLLLAIGRVDEAAGSAARALMVARATGDRRESARMRLLRAAIAVGGGQLVAALRDCDSVVDEARASGWDAVLAEALHERGVARFAAQRWREAADDLAESLALLRAAQSTAGDLAAAGEVDEAGDAARAEAIDAAEVSLLVALDRADRAEGATGRARPTHPLFGGR